MAPNDESSSPLTPYGMKASRKRLEEAGFHPAVTKRPLKELEAELTSYLKKKMTRPSRRSLLGRQRYRLHTVRRGRSGRFLSKADQPGRGAGRSRGPLTKGPYYPTERLDKIALEAVSKTPSPEAVTNGPKEQLTMESIMNHSQLGAKILNSVFAHGHKAVMNLALTSSTMFKLVTGNINRWDFSSGCYKVKGPSNVFVAMVPKQYTHEIKEVLSKYDFPVNSAKWLAALERLESEGDSDSQKLRAIGLEHEFFRMAKKFQGQCLRSNGPYWAAEDDKIDPRTAKSAVGWWNFDKEAINIMGSLKPLETMWSANQFEGSNKEYHMSLSLAMKGLLTLMTEMHTVSTYIEVVHLHDVPLVDRRMLATILRGMPHVVQVGVYRCPLVHFGDLIPILDLIHDINTGRRKKKLSEIKGFDFYPNYEDGMPYQHENAATYGLAWCPLLMDVGQRGFYGILLKAVMKAKALDLGQLFDKDGALMDWMAKVPNVPLGPYCFLDALYQYLEVEDEDPDGNDKRTQATYDLLKPTRIAFEPYLSLDWPLYYTKKMGSKFFCSSCGYETFREFFPGRAKLLPVYLRTCSACILQRALDEERGHGRAWKLDLLDRVCFLWQPEDFNLDAPLYIKGAGLIRLESTETERPNDSSALMRDNKFPFDSLVGVPSLEAVAKGSIMACLWTEAVAFAFRYDLQRRGILELRHQYHRRWNGVPAFPPTREDGGAPDHQDELQMENGEPDASFFDHRKALDVANRMKRNGW